MSDSTTRIVDLPDNTAMPVQQQMPNYGGLGNGGGGMSGNPSMSAGANAYIPMNVHPNPYGLSPENNVMSHPQPDVSGPKFSGMQQPSHMSVPMPPSISPEKMMQMQQQRLPPRDIPKDTTSYMQDEQIQANYIPRSRQSNDYVRDYENVTEKKLESHEQQKHRTWMVDNLVEEMQVPFLVALLFLIFQLPSMNSFLFKRFAFLSIYGEDGNMNFYGWMFKAVCFSAAFYSITKFTNYIGEL